MFLYWQAIFSCIQWLLYLCSFIMFIVGIFLNTPCIGHHICIRWQQTTKSYIFEITLSLKRPKIQPFLHGLDKGISHRIFAQGIPLHASIIIFTHNAGVRDAIPKNGWKISIFLHNQRVCLRLRNRRLHELTWSLTRSSAWLSRAWRLICKGVVNGKLDARGDLLI